MVIQYFASVACLHVPHHHPAVHLVPHKSLLSTTASQSSGLRSAVTATRRALSLSLLTSTVSTLTYFFSASPSKSSTTDFFELPNSGGVKVLDLRIGTGPLPIDGDQVAIHYLGRLAAKQGWRFDSTYDHKDSTGEPIPFVFILGSEKIISGIQAAVRSMKVGGVRRVIIPPSQGYQSTLQEPIPPNIFDRQRLFTTIFNPTRLANGEGSTLGTLVFDIERAELQQWINYCLRPTNSMSKTRVPNVEPSPFARRVGLKMVVNSLCLSKICRKKRRQ